MSKEFEIHQDIELPGTLEQVWKAVTDDTAAWMFPTGDWKAFVKTEEFPIHLVTRMEGPDGWFNQLEHQLTQGPQGTFLRYVHSGIFVDDWENQYDGAAKHTEFYLHTLGEYLAHFNGKPVTFSDVQGPDAATATNAFETFIASLGLEDAREGESHSLNLPGNGLTEVVVDFRNENFVGLRTKSSMIRIFGRNAFGHRVGLTIHDFDPDAVEQENTEAWQHAIDGAYA